MSKRPTTRAGRIALRDQNRAAREARHLAKQAQRKAEKEARAQAVTRLIQCSSSPPAEIGSWGVMRTRAWVKQANECKRLAGTVRIPTARLIAAIELLKSIPVASVDVINQINVKPNKY